MEKMQSRDELLEPTPPLTDAPPPAAAAEDEADEGVADAEFEDATAATAAAAPEAVPDAAIPWLASTSEVCTLLTSRILEMKTVI